MTSLNTAVERRKEFVGKVGRIFIGFALAVPILLLAAAWFQPLYLPATFTRDPLAVVSDMASNHGLACCSRFTGAISTAGVMLWSAAAAVTLTGSILLKGIGAERSEVKLMALVAVLCVWLALDDAFMLHEAYSPKVFGFSVSHFVPIIAMIPILLNLARTGVRKNLWILIVSLFALATSLLIDDIIGKGFTAVFVEDAFKFVGISLWTIYFVLLVIECVLNAASASREIAESKAQFRL